MQEQEVLGKLNLPSMQVRCVFLKLIPMGSLLAFIDAICSSYASSALGSNSIMVENPHSTCCCVCVGGYPPIVPRRAGPGTPHSSSTYIVGGGYPPPVPTNYYVCGRHMAATFTSSICAQNFRNMRCRYCVSHVCVSCKPGLETCMRNTLPEIM